MTSRVDGSHACILGPGAHPPDCGAIKPAWGRSWCSAGIAHVCPDLDVSISMAVSTCSVVTVFRLACGSVSRACTITRAFVARGDSTRRASRGGCGLAAGSVPCHPRTASGGPLSPPIRMICRPDCLARSSASTRCRPTAGSDPFRRSRASASAAASLWATTRCFPRRSYRRASWPGHAAGSRRWPRAPWSRRPAWRGGRGKTVHSRCPVPLGR